MVFFLFLFFFFFFCILIYFIFFFFFFSSRRRHTRSLRDWSSDVCSSDLHHHDRGGSDDDHDGRRAKLEPRWSDQQRASRQATYDPARQGWRCDAVHGRNSLPIAASGLLLLLIGAGVA